MAIGSHKGHILLARVHPLRHAIGSWRVLPFQWCIQKNEDCVPLAWGTPGVLLGKQPKPLVHSVDKPVLPRQFFPLAQIDEGQELQRGRDADSKQSG